MGGLAATSENPTPTDVALTDAMEAYDPAAGTWTAAAPLPTARVGLAAVTGRDGRIYAIGGSPNEQFPPSDVVEVYTPGTDTWETAAPLPIPLADVSATTDSAGNIYAFGGDVTEIYDADTKTWKTAPPMPTPRERAVVTAGTDDRIYVIGGFPASGDAAGPLRTVEVYTPATGRWSSAASLPHPAGQAAGVTALDGRIFVFGGNPDDGAAPSAAAYVYSPATDDWATVTPMPRPRNTHSAAIGPDGRIYLVGGDQGTTDAELGVLRNVDAYTP
ncbi:hypothetical protein OG871_36000 [Kitasatospora sp. NBC_00374]|uniref:Kelch repeat-containing protein n=1 Tax=Kitasatospora sp. NBC_00374 TaxID=2975964 RepID=UPI00324A7467